MVRKSTKTIKARKTRKYKRKTYKKKNQATTTMIARSMHGISDRLMVKLSYSDRGTITSATNGYYQFIGNGAFAPYSTASGHGLSALNEQPQYFDTYAAMYTKYRVMAHNSLLKY